MDEMDECINPLLCIVSWRITSLKQAQRKNASPPISETVDGISILRNDLQSRNAQISIFCRPSFNRTLLKLVQPSNACSQITLVVNDKKYSISLFSWSRPMKSSRFDSAKALERQSKPAVSNNDRWSSRNRPFSLKFGPWFVGSELLPSCSLPLIVVADADEC